MTITFRLPRTAIDRLAFAYSPLLEAVLSPHVLVEPKHHPVQHPWVRAMRGLPPALKREIAAFSFAYRSYLPAFLLHGATGDFPTFETDDRVWEEPTRSAGNVLRVHLYPAEYGPERQIVDHLEGACQQERDAQRQ